MSTKNELIVFNQSIAIPGVTFSRTGLRFDQPVTPELLVQVGTFLQAVDQCSAWWWGDFLVAYCGYRLKDENARGVDEITRGGKEKQYTAQYAYITGKDAQTLKNWRALANFFNSSCRQDELSHTHHIEAWSGSGGDKAIADHWLDLAVAGEWSCSRLRAEIRRKNRTELEPDEPLPQFLLPLQVVEFAQWAAMKTKRIETMELDEARAILDEFAPILELVAAINVKLGKITQAA